MRPAANDGCGRTWCLLLAAAVTVTALLVLPAVSAGTEADNVTTPESGSDHITAETSPATDNAEKAERRAAMRRVAWASLGIILLLIIFIVVVMILSRRMRIRYLGWDRRITFSKLWDVWWQKPGEKPGKKPDDPDRPKGQ